MQLDVVVGRKSRARRVPFSQDRVGRGIGGGGSGTLRRFSGPSPNICNRQAPGEVASASASSSGALEVVAGALVSRESRRAATTASGAAWARWLVADHRRAIALRLPAPLTFARRTDRHSGQQNRGVRRARGIGREMETLREGGQPPPRWP